jgi:uncharacterized protein
MRLAGPFVLLATFGWIGMVPVPCARAQVSSSQAELIARRNAVENELESIATIERKVMVPMRDG